MDQDLNGLSFTVRGIEEAKAQLDALEAQLQRILALRDRYEQQAQAASNPADQARLRDVARRAQDIATRLETTQRPKVEADTSARLNEVFELLGKIGARQGVPAASAAGVYRGASIDELRRMLSPAPFMNSTQVQTFQTLPSVDRDYIAKGQGQNAGLQAQISEAAAAAVAKNLAAVIQRFESMSSTSKDQVRADALKEGGAFLGDQLRWTHEQQQHAAAFEPIRRLMQNRAPEMLRQAEAVRTGQPGYTVPSLLGQQKSIDREVWKGQQKIQGMRDRGVGSPELLDGAQATLDETSARLRQEREAATRVAEARKRVEKLEEARRIAEGSQKHAEEFRRMGFPHHADQSQGMADRAVSKMPELIAQALQAVRQLDPGSEERKGLGGRLSGQARFARAGIADIEYRLAQDDALKDNARFDKERERAAKRAEQDERRREAAEQKAGMLQAKAERMNNAMDYKAGKLQYVAEQAMLKDFAKRDAVAQKEGMFQARAQRLNQQRDEKEYREGPEGRADDFGDWVKDRQLRIRSLREQADLRRSRGDEDGAKSYESSAARATRDMLTRLSTVGEELVDELRLNNKTAKADRLENLLREAGKRGNKGLDEMMGEMGPGTGGLGGWIARGLRDIPVVGEALYHAGGKAVAQKINGSVIGQTAGAVGSAVAGQAVTQTGVAGAVGGAVARAIPVILGALTSPVGIAALVAGGVGIVAARKASADMERGTDARTEERRYGDLGARLGVHGRLLDDARYPSRHGGGNSGLRDELFKLGYNTEDYASLVSQMGVSGLGDEQRRAAGITGLRLQRGYGLTAAEVGGASSAIMGSDNPGSVNLDANLRRFADVLAQGIEKGISSDATTRTFTRAMQNATQTAGGVLSEGQRSSVMDQMLAAMQSGNARLRGEAGFQKIDAINDTVANFQGKDVAFLYRALKGKTGEQLGYTGKQASTYDYWLQHDPATATEYAARNQTNEIRGLFKDRFIGAYGGNASTLRYGLEKLGVDKSTAAEEAMAIREQLKSGAKPGEVRSDLLDSYAGRADKSKAGPQNMYGTQDENDNYHTALRQELNAHEVKLTASRIYFESGLNQMNIQAVQSVYLGVNTARKEMVDANSAAGDAATGVMPSGTRQDRRREGRRFDVAEAGYADGGFTGPGGKYDPAGVVHKGEFVVNAEATKKYMPILMAMNENLPGYSAGGFVKNAAGAAMQFVGDGIMNGIVGVSNMLNGRLPWDDLGDMREGHDLNAAQRRAIGGLTPEQERARDAAAAKAHAQMIAETNAYRAKEFGALPLDADGTMPTPRSQPTATWTVAPDAAPKPATSGAGALVAGPGRAVRATPVRAASGAVAAGARSRPGTSGEGFDYGPLIAHTAAQSVARAPVSADEQARLDAGAPVHANTRALKELTRVLEQSCLPTPGGGRAGGSVGDPGTSGGLLGRFGKWFRGTAAGRLLLGGAETGSGVDAGGVDASSIGVGETGSNGITSTANAALSGRWAEDTAGYCSRFVRQVFERTLGKKDGALSGVLFGASAIESGNLWKQRGLTMTGDQVKASGGYRPGDTLFQMSGSGGYGHVGIVDETGKYVIENSTRGKGGKMRTPISKFGNVDMVGRLSLDRDGDLRGDGIPSGGAGAFRTAVGQVAGGATAFIQAISEQESRNNYNARNKRTGAMGKYQIMPQNILGWGKNRGKKNHGWDYEALGRDITPQEFMRSPELQERIAQFQLNKAYKKYGAAGAARWWYSNDAKSSSKRPAANEPSPDEYAQQVVGRMRSNRNVTAGGPGVRVSGEKHDVVVQVQLSGPGAAGATATVKANPAKKLAQQGKVRVGVAPVQGARPGP